MFDCANEGGGLLTANLTRLTGEHVTAGSDDDHVDIVRSWVGNFLAKPHADLGRAGPVCPFARPALDRHSLWIATVRGAAPPEDEVTALLAEVLARFRELPSEAGADGLLTAALVALPDLTDHALIDRVQQALKPNFVHEGLMIGQFYPGCRESGLWNADFRPLECPVPLIAIRHMVSNDFPFLSVDASWIESYLRRFAPAMPSQVRSTLARGFGVEAERVRP